MTDALSKLEKGKEANQDNSKQITAKEILGNPKYQAICYSGFRGQSRSVQPTLEEVKEDLRIIVSHEYQGDTHL